MKMLEKIKFFEEAIWIGAGLDYLIKENTTSSLVNSVSKMMMKHRTCIWFQIQMKYRVQIYPIYYRYMEISLMSGVNVA